MDRIGALAGVLDDHVLRNVDEIEVVAGAASHLVFLAAAVEFAHLLGAMATVQLVQIFERNAASQMLVEHDTGITHAQFVTRFEDCGGLVRLLGDHRRQIAEPAADCSCQHRRSPQDRQSATSSRMV